MRYAVIDSGVVANIILLPDDFKDTSWDGKDVVPANGAAIGDTWDGHNFIKPPQPEPQGTVYPQFTALELLDLFTEAEQLAVVQATLSDAAVKLWYDRLIAATFVTYQDPRTEGGLQALVDAGLLTQDRKDEIVQQMLPD